MQGFIVEYNREALLREVIEKMSVSELLDAIGETTDGQCYQSIDANNDGHFDPWDTFPKDPNEWADSDGDEADQCDNDPNKTTPGVCGRGTSDVDTDNDGVYCNDDNCPDVWNPDQTNSDTDIYGDAYDAFPEDGSEWSDRDGDGCGDNSDLAPDDPDAGCGVDPGITNGTYFYHTDPLGTPLAMTDESGNKVWSAQYKPFGEEHSIDTALVKNQKRLIGKEKDEETGLHYFGARYMEEEPGRFVSPDPIRAVDPQTGAPNEDILLNPQRGNLYAYGLNNPYRYVDPDGMRPKQETKEEKSEKHLKYGITKNKETIYWRDL